MERGIVMLLHSLAISLVAYLAMVYGLGQKQSVAENRSLLLGAVLLIYMLVFGHGLPTQVRKDLF